MARPGYVTRCWICYERIETVDDYKMSKWDDERHVWITRLFDPDWMIERHIRREHC